MEKIGIICEYNPFHNGHAYHINEIKKRYPDSIIILILNGYFLERGEVSIINKYDKCTIALQNGIDLVIELPVLFGCQSADTFAYNSIYLLNMLKVNRIIFGSESNDINTLYSLAKQMLDNSQDKNIKILLDKGLNYPTALAKSLNSDFVFNSNDLLGISYIKSTLLINKNITCETIQRTNNYLDTTSNENIISAQNIRNKIKNEEDISEFLPKESYNKINVIDYNLFFNILKSLIIEKNDLNTILDVDEGIEHRLFKGIISCDSLEDFIDFIKTKRYTFNKINRMFIHIILGITKSDAKEKIDYIKVLGFNEKGKKYLNSIKKDLPLLINKQSKIYKYEIKASLIYDMLTGDNSYENEKNNKPIII